MIGKGIEVETKTFGTFTEVLYQLVGWLQNNSITHIAMESTGVYWKIFSLFCWYMPVIVSKFRVIKQIKRERMDCQTAQERITQSLFCTATAVI